MTISSNDIKLFFSGGLTNNDPDLCLGGEMSTTFFTTDRLFDYVSGDQTSSGYTDYRCVYYHNLSNTDTLYNAKVFISNEVVGGSDVLIGLEINNDRQDVYITNATSVASGTFTLMFYDYITDSDIQFTVTQNANINIWASNFQTSIRSITGLEDVIVSGSYIGSTAYFQVSFNGTAAYRYFETMQFVNFSQSFIDVNANLTVQKIIDGGPKLKTALEIGNETTSPTNVVFQSTSLTSPIFVGDLRPNEYFAIWIKRVVASNTSPQENDGFTIKLKGEIT